MMTLWALLWCSVDFIAWNVFHTVLLRAALANCVHELWNTDRLISGRLIFVLFLFCMEQAVMSGSMVTSLLMTFALGYVVYLLRTLFDTYNKGYILLTMVIFLIIDEICIKKGCFISSAAVYSTLSKISVNMVLMYSMMGMRDNRSKK